MSGLEGAAVAGVLNVLAKKLAPLVIKQYSSLVGVTKDLQDVRGLVEEINCWLEKVGSKAMDNGQLFNWLRQLKHVVYDVDDIVDEFLLEAEKHEDDGGNHIMSKCLVTKPKAFLFQCKAAHKIKAIKKRFAAIVKQRTDFSAIVNSLPDGHPASHINRTSRVVPTLPIVDEASIHGRDQEKHEIISKLVHHSNNQQIIKIVSIVGLGGCGKTALAKLVFNEGNTVKKHFQVRRWVHVSQEFYFNKLVEKMFEAISGEKSISHTLPKMAKTISDMLTGKRYLLVLDDVWIEDRIEWEEFMVLVKCGAHGSGILLTTRSMKVAEAVDSTEPFNLPFLSEVDSWAVFNQSFGMAIKRLDSEFLEVGRKIVRKCGGVPLAIKVIAGVLCHKKRIEEWLAMRDINLLDVEDKEHRVSACLMLSYFHLPSHLKPCFTMCSLFPKGHRIDKKQLIDLWIAHNMINLPVGVDCLEDSGDENFNSLVQVSFLQDVDEHNGRVSCKMHDLVHDLARSILLEEISTNVSVDAINSIKGYRYFSLVEQPRKLLPNKIFHNARAIYVDEGNDIIFSKALKNAKHLRSIIVNFNQSITVLTSIVHLKNLKYLEISYVQCQTLPESISDIWYLQAMHLTYSCLLELPKSIGKLKKLRTLNLSHSEELKCLPDSIGDCNMLSTIDLCSCTELTSLPNSIGRSEKLRVLRLGYTQIKKLPSGITTLRNLECLDLYCCWELEELPEGICNLGKLQVLNLEGCEKLEGMPVGVGQLNRLQKLGLFVVGKREKFARISELANVGKNSGYLSIKGIVCVMEPHDTNMACLKRRANLQRLNLEWNRYDMAEVNPELEQKVLDGLEPPHGIKDLKICGYSGKKCARWMLNQAVGGVQGLAYFRSLRVMKLYDFPNLRHLHGLVELPCLEKLKLADMPSLESIRGGSFPSLVKLAMCNLPSLGEVWMVVERTMSGGEEGGRCSNCTPHLGQEFRVGNCLSYLNVTDCPKLKVKPHLPLLLHHWWISGNSEQLLQFQGRCEACSLLLSFSHLKKLRIDMMVGSGGGWKLLEHMMALQSLDITSSDALIGLPESLGSLASLQSLSVSFCSAIHGLPNCLGKLRSLQKLTIQSCCSLSSLPESMGDLKSLQELWIEQCAALDQLPECLGGLRSLCKLNINLLPGLTCLPESMYQLTSLEELRISYCTGLTSLPNGMKCLASLQKLIVFCCPGIKSLPEDMNGLSSLKNMRITGCPGITSLPEGIKGLIALQEMWIDSCPGNQILARWHKRPHRSNEIVAPWQP